MNSRFRHWVKLATNTAYRRNRSETIRLQNLPSHLPTTTTLLGKPFEILDAESFRYTRREIFEKQIYRFESRNQRPLIIDGGANVGLSVIYFKTLFPNSQIVAFEPDPDVFRVLERNCQTFSLDDVQTIRKGLWSSNTTLQFEQEGSEAGHIVQNGGDSARTIDVQVVRLRDYLNQKVDLLKLDIEGAETEALIDSADKLGNVDNIFVEYHSFAGKPQTLDALIGLLTKSGYRIHVSSIGTCQQPFISRPVFLGMDLQLNIYGVRTRD